MKDMVPALTPLLRSNTQGELLATLFLSPDEEFSLSDLARRVGAFPSTVHREIGRWSESGIVRDRMVGRSRMVRANPDHELAGSLAELLLLSYGPRAVLEPLVQELPGVRDAFIYGSWAARYRGQAGPAPQDIDVLVIGSTPRNQLAELGRIAQERLRKEVNVTRISADDWDAEVKPFVTTVKSRPLVPLARKESPS